MTPFEIKETEKEISTLEKIIIESEEKRVNAERQLIAEARQADHKNKSYRDALQDTIRLETQHILGCTNRLSEIKLKLDGNVTEENNLWHRANKLIKAAAAAG